MAVQDRKCGLQRSIGLVLHQLSALVGAQSVIWLRLLGCVLGRAQ